MDDKKLTAEALTVAADRYEYFEFCALGHADGQETDLVLEHRRKAIRCRELAAEAISA